ncbi:SAGA complex subunit Hfi1 [Schizosaccharomyces cryophilus OY26]|uniref:SAGA complex subunit Hfi1 n=1 Tax=Schizosaccharomyces cryophilus (strain OY26 / ATCC MYA-4695 / CBS 11777 / NBRC 106824 / NRRL Y48691) TaxID=653667 RepID=S9VW80_SCHCR|nr:SAGA complex subunit Hfi1 [Schizosaccharomyces cryophilus OY26]EPY50494.1 SAGA complex subunit Hfi1 [Schizosaccharomyces cryophilus OY26]
MVETSVEKVETTVPKDPNSKGESNVLIKLVSELQSLLGNEYETYTMCITDFIVGQLSRKELNNLLSKYSNDPKFVKLHNQFILSIVKDLQRSGKSAVNKLPWVKRKRSDGALFVHKKFTSHNAQAKKLKKIILSLSSKDRERIKAVLKEKSSTPPQLPGLLLETRIAKLPKIPVSRDKLNSVFVNDIKAGYVAPLASETLEVPDADSLKERITAIALENGLLGGIEKSVPEVILAGLENHIKNIFSKCFSIMDRLLDKRRHHESSFTIQDLNLTLSIEPHMLVEEYPHDAKIPFLLHDAAMEDELSTTTRDFSAPVPDYMKPMDASFEEREAVAALLDDVLPSE